MQLALDMAKAAFEIQKKAPGRFLVKQLLKVQPRQQRSVGVMQNVVCHVGESFEQHMVELMVSLCCMRASAVCLSPGVSHVPVVLDWWQYC